ncbi:hypothetical protein Efla_006399 [Eimeria flavescens]
MKRERHFQRSQAVASWEEKAFTTGRLQISNYFFSDAASHNIALQASCWHHSTVVADPAIQEFTSSMVHLESAEPIQAVVGMIDIAQHSWVPLTCSRSAHGVCTEERLKLGKTEVSKKAPEAWP